jgi:hypothetical protein
MSLRGKDFHDRETKILYHFYGIVRTGPGLGRSDLEVVDV